MYYNKDSSYKICLHIKKSKCCNDIKHNRTSSSHHSFSTPSPLFAAAIPRYCIGVHRQDCSCIAYVPLYLMPTLQGSQPRLKKIQTVLPHNSEKYCPMNFFHFQHAVPLLSDVYHWTISACILRSSWPPCQNPTKPPTNLTSKDSDKPPQLLPTD